MDFLNTIEKKFPVEILPLDLFREEKQDSGIVKFQEEIILKFQQAKGLFLFQNPEILHQCKDTVFIIRRTLLLIEKVFQIHDIEQIMITGGASAFQTLQHLNMKILIPDEELAPGVINFRIAGNSNLKIALKPGSYPWGVKFI